MAQKEITLIGVQVSAGDYEGTRYDNLKFHAVLENTDDEDLIGEAVANYKLKNTTQNKKYLGWQYPVKVVCEYDTNNKGYPVLIGFKEV